MSSFAAYVLGTLVLVAGLAAGAYLLGIAITWIAVGAIVIIGLGIMGAVTHGKRRDLPVNPET